MTLKYAIDEMVESYSLQGKSYPKRTIVDLKILKPETTFFDSDIINHCRFILNDQDISVIENIKGEPEEAPHLVLYAKEDSAIRILEGNLDPLQAFLGDKLRIEGSTELAIEIAKIAE